MFKCEFHKNKSICNYSNIGPKGCNLGSQLDKYIFSAFGSSQDHKVIN
jgi:hypothetical protein